jgi:hypothetical protein
MVMMSVSVQPARADTTKCEPIPGGRFCLTVHVQGTGIDIVEAQATVRGAHNETASAMEALGASHVFIPCLL